MSPVNKVGLYLWTLMVLISRPSAAIQVYNFCMETDNEIIFRFAFRNDSEYDYEMYSGHLVCSFYRNGEAIEDNCLKPGQLDRLTVKVQKTEDELMVTLTVRGVQKEDEGPYILLVTEARDGKRNNDVLDAYINVIAPPGRAQCENVTSSYSPDWIEVHCSAPLGMDSDPQGSIACFQNGKKAPFLSQPEHSVNHIEAVYWMDVESSISCCSYVPQCEKPPETCVDFTYTRETVSVSTDKNVPKTGGEMTLQQSTTSPLTMIHTEGPCGNGQGFNTAAMISILAILLAFLVILVVIKCIIMKRFTCACTGEKENLTSQNGIIRMSKEESPPQYVKAPINDPNGSDDNHANYTRHGGPIGMQDEL